MYLSTAKKAAEIQEIVAKHYEPHRQDRCKKWVYRNLIKPRFGICERTFFQDLYRPTEVPAKRKESHPQATVQYLF